jgi:phage terminase large subunit-like protein
MKKYTRGEKVIAFVEKYCVVPEGDLRGQPIKLLPFQKEFILAVYDNPAGTRRAYLSIARKNAKTATIACILLAHICGPEAVANSRIVSGAMSRDQAAEVYNYASKMLALSPEMAKITRCVPSKKQIFGLTRNVEYMAISAEGRTAHGKSPVLAILDEVGQVKGPQSDFIDAIVTAQGAYDNAMLFAISTQAANDNDLFSIWLDDARNSSDPRIVSHVYEADKECRLDDQQAWKAANPALGIFRSFKDVEEQADRALRMPSFESTFRNLVLNQRIETVSPFISKGTWLLNSSEVNNAAFYESEVFVGLDLSAKTDLTAMVMAAQHENKWHIKCKFWTPEKGLRERAKTDRAPYDVWADQGFITTLPGASIDYEQLARDIAETLDGMVVRSIGFDRWRFDILKKEFEKIGVEFPLEPFGQGFKDMAPAIDALESLLLNEKIAHGANPVLTMCMANARIEKDAAGNRKMNKFKATGRIDGAVALTMAIGMIAKQNNEDSGDLDGFIMSPLNLKA